MMDTAKQLGWSNCDVSFSRGKNSASGTANDAMQTDFRVNLEPLRIINGDDKLHCKYIYIIMKCDVIRELSFHKQLYS